MRPASALHIALHQVVPYACHVLSPSYSYMIVVVPDATLRGQPTSCCTTAASEVGNFGLWQPDTPSAGRSLGSVLFGTFASITKMHQQVTQRVTTGSPTIYVYILHPNHQAPKSLFWTRLPSRSHIVRIVETTVRCKEDGSSCSGSILGLAFVTEPASCDKNVSMAAKCMSPVFLAHDNRPTQLPL